MLTLGKPRHTDPHGPPPTPSISPRTAASNAVPCYRQHLGMQPGLSLSPGGSPSSKDPPPPPEDSPNWGGEAPAGIAVGGGPFPSGGAMGWGHPANPGRP